jgi:hypothetical protein
MAMIPDEQHFFLKRLEIETGETALPCVDKYNKQPQYFHQQASSQTHAQMARTYGLFVFYGNKIGVPNQFQAHWDPQL